MREVHIIVGILIAVGTLLAMVGIVVVAELAGGGRGFPYDEAPLEQDFRAGSGYKGADDAAPLPVASVAELRRRIQEAPPGDLRGVLEQLTSSEFFFGREALLRATGDWMVEERWNEVRCAALALFESGHPDAVLVDLFEVSTMSLLAEGISAAKRSEHIEGLGRQVASILENRIEKEQLPIEERDQILHALIRFGGAAPVGERGLFVATALGGAPEGNPHAVGHLAGIVRESRDPAVQSIAAHHLGKIGSVRDLLERTGMTLDPPPTDPEDVAMCGGFLRGLHLAVTRRPGDVAIATPALDEVLRNWNESADQDQMRVELLELLASHPVPELASTLADLVRKNDEAVASAAEQALVAIDRF